MINPDRLLPFTLGDQRYALALSSVKNVVRAVTITPLPKAPEIVLGIINVRGRVIPVVDVRKRFGFAPRELRLSDQFIIAQTPKRTVALVADRVEGLIEIDEQAVISAGQVLPRTDYVEGVVKLADGMLLIHDLAGFLSLDEEQALSDALQENGGQQ
jgi:purine-binding chemotaxis protein CheW